MLGFWLRLKCAFKWQKESQEDNSWGKEIKRKIASLGLGDIWSHIQGSDSGIIKRVKLRVKDIERQEWKAQCRGRRTLEEFNGVMVGVDLKLRKACKRSCRGFIW